MLSLDLKRNPEEAANTLTHGAGAVSSAAGGATLVALAAQGDVWQFASAAIYSLSMVLLYVASTLFHWEEEPVAKRRFEVFDHCAIYIAIAGTYTPFLLVTLRDGVGGPMLAVIWTLAAAGVAFKLVFATRFRLCSTLCYIAMGWLIVLVGAPMFQALPTVATLLLVVGGLAYTVGTYFFYHERFPYTHTIWHLFVLLGSACHFVAVATQVVPGA
ncbi:MAG TPA: hemolysin III family protein [Chloroflexaceae bacterium]|nr:hemolysin III family protein [Chloroflexaceae bacterium]